MKKHILVCLLALSLNSCTIKNYKEAYTCEWTLSPEGSQTLKKEITQPAGWEAVLNLVPILKELINFREKENTKSGSEEDGLEDLANAISQIQNAENQKEFIEALKEFAKRYPNITINC